MKNLTIRLSLSGDADAMSKVRTKLLAKLPNVNVNPAGPGGTGTGSWVGIGLTSSEVREAQTLLWEILDNDPKHYPRSHPPQNWEIDHVWIYVSD